MAKRTFGVDFPGVCRKFADPRPPMVDGSEPSHGRYGVLPGDGPELGYPEMRAKLLTSRDALKFQDISFA